MDRNTRSRLPLGGQLELSTIQSFMNSAKRHVTYPDGWKNSIGIASWLSLPPSLELRHRALPQSHVLSQVLNSIIDEPPNIFGNWLSHGIRGAIRNPRL